MEQPFWIVQLLCVVNAVAKSFWVIARAACFIFIPLPAQATLYYPNSFSMQSSWLAMSLISLGIYSAA